ncbi:hypothetical protein U5A82_02775 [Sphingobium sp. CR2-8]|uniref:hypothetical protein n=1 Tax=Sphingobium sp. CR2-8 TaxID=1306534 RepID=UPI002DBA40AC|nr:hypothetical protein [Sphingobium sp. CR2-8]MEC3909433.1 hypothetical protein [Sphingobium sp. CR2-8]
MMQVRYYDPAERQQEKERQRASDALLLREGRISPAELRERNGFFSSVEVIDSSISFQEVFA